MKIFPNLAARLLKKPTGLSGSITAAIWNQRNAALNDTVLQLLEIKPDDSILEIGFGGGYLLSRLAPLLPDGYLAGVDFSQNLVNRAKNRFQKYIKTGRMELKRGAAESLPIPDSQFTKVCSVNSIFNWRDLRQGLAEIKRVLRKNGLILLCFTGKTSLERQGFAKNLPLVEIKDLERLLAELGFINLEVSSFNDKHRQYFCIKALKTD